MYRISWPSGGKGVHCISGSSCGSQMHHHLEWLYLFWGKPNHEIFLKWFSRIVFFYIYPLADVFHEYVHSLKPMLYCWCHVVSMWCGKNVVNLRISVCSRPQKRRTTWQRKKSHFTVSTLAVEQHNNFIMTTTIYVATVNKSSGCLEHVRALLVYLSLPPTLPFPRPLALQKKYFESMLNTND